MAVSNIGSPSAGQQRLATARAKPADSTWSWLYRVAGAAAVISVALLPIVIIVYSFSPPPSTVLGSFAQLQANRLVGLIDLDLVMLVDSALMIPIFLALYVALRAPVNPSWRSARPWAWSGSPSTSPRIPPSRCWPSATSTRP